MVIKVILGRYGDIYQVCKASKTPCYIACLKQFRGIVDELFPDFQVIELPDFKQSAIDAACAFVKFKYQSATIIPCQFFGTDYSSLNFFRNYQSHQEFCSAYAK